MKSEDKVLGRSTFGVADAASRMLGRAGKVVGVLIAAMAALALAVAPAGATTGHNFSGQFGTPFSNDPGGFQGGGPVGVALDQATGDVYVTDPGHQDPNTFASAPRVERFDSTGAFQSEFAIDPNAYNSPQAIAIDPNGAGALWVGVTDNTTGTGTVVKYALDGTPANVTVTPDPGTSLNAGAVAVDPATGFVYVGGVDGNGAPIVEIFDDAGVFQSSFDGSDDTANDGPFAGVASIAVGDNGHVYVSDPGKNRLNRFSAAGAFQATVASAASTVNGPFVGYGAVAADPVSDEVYLVENGNRVEVFTAGGADHQDIFAGFVGSLTGLAVNNGSGTVYLADQGSSVGQIATPVPASTVATTGSSAVDATSATLEGTVNPEGIDTSYYFEYGTNADYGGQTPGGAAGSGNTTDPYTDQATGLLPNTQYFFRIVGQNTDFSGAVRGETLSFTTAPAAPIIEGTPSFASEIQPDGAKLNGTINPQGSNTTWHFEYGTTTAYGSTAPGSDINGQGDQGVNVPITGLTPGTTYHFRLVANNGTGGDQTGPDHTFRTAPAAPAEATSVTGITAELAGTVNPQGHATTYHFEYGETAPGYGFTTPERSAGSANGEVTVTASIDKLKPGTLYHVRVIATDTTTGVTTTGVDGTFTTNPAPSATTGDVTGVTTDSATFTGLADTHGLGGTFTFYVTATSSPFVTRTDAVTIAPGTPAGPVSATLTGLQPGQTYTVRLGVDSSLVTTVGDTVTFATAPLPPVLPPPPPPTVDNPYGCANPVLKAYNSHPKPGDTITIQGSDLGVGGTVALGGDVVTPSNWTASSFSIVVPDDAKGSLPLTVNCGKGSNTVAIQIYQAPSNTFATPKGKVKGSTASVTLKVPGPGDITIKGSGLKTAKKHVGKAGTYTVKATLSASGKKSLKRHKKLARTLSVSFKPNGGTAATKKVKVTFKR